VGEIDRRQPPIVVLRRQNDWHAIVQGGYVELRLLSNDSNTPQSRLPGTSCHSSEARFLRAPQDFVLLLHICIE
jgi:hypothetical protein